MFDPDKINANNEPETIQKRIKNEAKIKVM